MTGKKFIAYSLIVLLVLTMGYLFSGWHILNILEKNYLAIAKSMTRNDVKNILTSFHEVKVQRQEVPRDYRE